MNVDHVERSITISLEIGLKTIALIVIADLILEYF